MTKQIYKTLQVKELDQAITEFLNDSDYGSGDVSEYILGKFPQASQQDYIDLAWHAEIFEHPAQTTATKAPQEYRRVATGTYGEAVAHLINSKIPEKNFEQFLQVLTSFTNQQTTQNTSADFASLLLESWITQFGNNLNAAQIQRISAATPKSAAVAKRLLNRNLSHYRDEINGEVFTTAIALLSPDKAAQLRHCFNALNENALFTPSSYRKLTSYLQPLTEEDILRTITTFNSSLSDKEQDFFMDLLSDLNPDFLKEDRIYRALAILRTHSGVTEIMKTNFEHIAERLKFGLYHEAELVSESVQALPEKKAQLKELFLNLCRLEETLRNPVVVWGFLDRIYDEDTKTEFCVDLKDSLEDIIPNIALTFRQLNDTNFVRIFNAFPKAAAPLLAARIDEKFKAYRTVGEKLNEMLLAPSVDYREIFSLIYKANLLLEKFPNVSSHDVTGIPRDLSEILTTELRNKKGQLSVKDIFRLNSFGLTGDVNEALNNAVGQIKDDLAKGRIKPNFDEFAEYLEMFTDQHLASRPKEGYKSDLYLKNILQLVGNYVRKLDEETYRELVENSHEEPGRYFSPSAAAENFYEKLDDLIANFTTRTTSEDKIAASLLYLRSDIDIDKDDYPSALLANSAKHKVPQLEIDRMFSSNIDFWQENFFCDQLRLSDLVSRLRSVESLPKPKDLDLKAKTNSFSLADRIAIFSNMYLSTNHQSNFGEFQEQIRYFASEIRSHKVPDEKLGLSEQFKALCHLAFASEDEQRITEIIDMKVVDEVLESTSRTNFAAILAKAKAKDLASSKSKTPLGSRIT